MKKYIIVAFSIACLGLSSCTDVLDRPSETKYTDDTYWTSEDQYRLYFNYYYPYYFTGYNSSYGTNFTPVRAIHSVTTLPILPNKPVSRLLSRETMASTIWTHGPEPSMEAVNGTLHGYERQTLLLTAWSHIKPISPKKLTITGWASPAFSALTNIIVL